MSNHTLPAQLNPEKICRQASNERQQYKGTLLLGDIPELTDELRDQKSVTVSYAVDFSQDDEGICVINGEISTNLTLICQRCLKPLPYALHSTFRVSPVHTDMAAKQLPDKYEPLMVAEGEINVAAWIAEELHLALPFAPRHEPSCKSYVDDFKKGAEETKQPRSPFAALKGKVKNNKNVN